MRLSGGLAGVAASVLLIGLAASPAAAAVAAGTSLYVDVSVFAFCSDKGPGTLAEPFCTVQHAANVVSPGQTVDIMSSEANATPQSATITRSGTPDAPITFTWLRTASEPDDPTLSPDNQTGHAVITLKSVHDVTLSDLQIGNYGTDDGIDVIGSQDISVAGATIGHVATQASPIASAAVSIDGASSTVTVSRTLFNGSSRYAVLAAPGARAVTVTTSAVQQTRGSGFVLNGTSGATVTSNTVLVFCSANNPAADGVALAGGTSGTVENNVLDTLTPASGCTVPSAGLSVDASSAGGVTADYNALKSAGSGSDYSWAGTAYADPASFAAATGQGTHDLTPPQGFEEIPPEGSPAIDSANCLAPGELSTDINGSPRVRDPLATDASLGNGTCFADRGAFERQDSVPVRYTIPVNSAGYPAGAVPYAAGVTVTSAATSPWNEPVSYTVDFGDGSAAVAAIPGTAATHQYTAVGQYQITVTASDTSGSTASSVSTAFAVPDQPMKAKLSAAPDGLHSVTGITPDLADFTDKSGIPSWEISSRSIAFGGNGAAFGSGDPQVTWAYVYAKPGTYTATETVTDLLGRKSTAAATITVGDGQQDVIPELIYDRDLPAHAVVKIPLSKLDLGSGSDAALVDVIVTSPQKAGYVSVYPDGTPRPADATVRFQAGKAAENSALATGGTVDFYNGSAGTIQLDLVTYGIDDIMTQGGGALGDTYSPVTPARVLNTRIAANHRAEFHVAGFDHIPATASDVMLDITVTKGATAGLYSVYQGGTANQFGVTAGYWATGQQVTNLAMVPVADKQAFVENDGAGAANFTAFVVGYYVLDAAAAVFLPATPHRLARITIGARRSASLAVAGKYGIPANGTTAVSVNLTASGATASGTVAAYAGGTKLPALVSLSYARGAAAANAAIVAVGADGAIRLYNAGPKPITVTVDLTGSYYLFG